MNARSSENYLAISSKCRDFLGRDILGTNFYRAESSLIQSSCRSFIRVIVPYEISKVNFRVVECVSVLPGNRCLQNIEFFFLRQYVHPCLLKNPKYTFYTIKSSLKLAYKCKDKSFLHNVISSIYICKPHILVILIFFPFGP